MYLMYVVLFKLLNGKHAQSCPTLCNPCRASLPVEFSQARILEWVAISYSGDLPDPGINPHLHLLHGQAGSLPLAPPAKPSFLITLCYFVKLPTSCYL